VLRKKLSKDEIAAKPHLNLPSELKQKYIDILYKHLKAISANKYDLGLAANIKHKIHLNQGTENSSRSQRLTKTLLNNH